MSAEHTKPRILFLSSCVNGGGAGNSLQTYLRSEGNQIEAHVVIPEEGIQAAHFRKSAKVWIVPEFVERIHRSPYEVLKNIQNSGVHLVANWWAVPKATREIAKIAREIDADLIYANHMLAEPVAVMVGKMTNIPVVLHARNIHVTKFGAWFYKLLAKQDIVRGIISNSAATALIYQDVCPEKVRVVHNFVDTEKFQRNGIEPALRKEYGIPKHAVVFGYMGRFVPWKGVDLLLEAFAPVYRSSPQAYLCILGDNDGGQHRDFKQEYMKRARELGVADRTVFIGFKEDVRPILSDFDVLTLPSLQPEPFGRVLIEAMALGIPSIVSAHGGAIEVIEHGENGLWFQTRSAFDLARQMQLMVQYPEMREKMGDKGKELVENLYQSGALAHEITRILETIHEHGDISRAPHIFPLEAYETTRALEEQKSLTGAMKHPIAGHFRYSFSNRNRKVSDLPTSFSSSEPSSGRSPRPRK